MTPEEKAKELLKSMMETEVELISTYMPRTKIILAKSRSFICVDEILKSYEIPIVFNREFTDEQVKDWYLHVKKLNDYWDEVKAEIEKL